METDRQQLRMVVNDISSLINLIQDTLDISDTSPIYTELLKVDVGILNELVMRLNDELNPQ